MSARFIAFALAAGFAGGAMAQDLGGTCRVASTYDLTFGPAALVFERPQVAPRTVRMHDGTLSTDGRAVSLRPD